MVSKVQFSLRSMFIGVFLCAVVLAGGMWAWRVYINCFAPLPYFMTRVESAPRLLTDLRSRDPEKRAHAAMWLAAWKDPKTIGPLVNALDDENDEVVGNSARTLGEMRALSAVPALIRTLRHKDISARGHAAEALGHLGDRAATAPLIDGLKPDAPHSFVTALGFLKDPAAVDPLVELLRHGDHFQRNGAAEALGRIGDPRAVPALIESLHDDEASLRWFSARALRDIGGPGSVMPLIEAMDDPDGQVRESAAAGLGELGDSRAIPVLTAHLNDPDKSARQKSQLALETLQPDGAANSSAGAVGTPGTSNP